MPSRPASASPTTVLYIKHMVCPHGIRVVRQALEGLGLQVFDVRLGAATIAGAPDELNWPQLRPTLETAQFAPLEAYRQTLGERVRHAVNQLLPQPGELLPHRAFEAEALPMAEENASNIQAPAQRRHEPPLSRCLD